MSAPQTITMNMVRQAMRSHCKAGVAISNAELYRILDLKNEKEKDRLRTRLNGMVNQDEVFRVGPGKYEYNFKFRLRKNTTFPVIWRFVRMQKEEWSFSDLCQLTRISYSQVKRYCEWLENEEYIVRYGKKGATITYRATEKAELTPETPYPDISDRNPFERENAAAAELARLMLCHDPYQSTTARKIVAACNVLRARFDPTFNQNENNGGSNHV
ncbi:MAG: hypothetical protein DELT_02553 [Desulfovibrio sp.]